MKINKQELFADLQRRTTDQLSTLEFLFGLSYEKLQTRPGKGSWTVLENIEHLIRYAVFYVPAIEQAAAKAKQSKKRQFASGYLGNKFAISMLPRSKMMKVSTFKSKNPIGSRLSRDVLDTFRSYLLNLQIILDQLQDLDLDVRTATTIPLIRIKLGDTLRVVIYHHERHFRQIQRCLAIIQNIS